MGLDYGSNISGEIDFTAHVWWTGFQPDPRRLKMILICLGTWLFPVR